MKPDLITVVAVAETNEISIPGEVARYLNVREGCQVRLVLSRGYAVLGKDEPHQEGTDSPETWDEVV